MAAGPSVAWAAPRAGLSPDEVAARQSRDGPNVLPRPARRSPTRQLVTQWTHFFAGLLWIAIALAVVAGLPQLAMAIAVVVLINRLFAFLQEHRAERAADRRDRRADVAWRTSPYPPDPGDRSARARRRTRRLGVSAAFFAVSLLVSCRRWRSVPSRHSPTSSTDRPRPDTSWIGASCGARSGASVR